MEKETYANKLDRLVNEMIEYININSDLEKEVGPDHYIYAKGDLKYEMDFSKVSRHEITWQGQLVYQRIDGRTEICRPGEWAMELCEWHFAEYQKRQREDVADAIKQATARNTAFTPV